ncbi:MAG: hypothetical protein JWS10_2076 [Cypionkella sp.]|nr:hypothetical protein [Cypionkella sp.]
MTPQANVACEISTACFKAEVDGKSRDARSVRALFAEGAGRGAKDCALRVRIGREFGKCVDLDGHLTVH